MGRKTKVGPPTELIALRVPPDLLRRADALKGSLARDATLAAVLGRITRTTVLRLALTRGLDLLEQERR